MDRFADDGKLGQGFTSADDLVEVDIGDGDRPRHRKKSIKIVLLGIMLRCLD